MSYTFVHKYVNKTKLKCSLLIVSLLQNERLTFKHLLTSQLLRLDMHRHNLNYVMVDIKDEKLQKNMDTAVQVGLPLNERN